MTNNSIRIGMRASFTAASILSAPLAFAQAGGAGSPASTGDTQLEEIIVTAQRRVETLQHAALAVSVVGTDELRDRNVTVADDLTKVVPSVSFATGGGGSTQVSLRGIGALTGNALQEQVVAFNLDGVYLARSGGSSGQFFDLNRIEVLKGPQGTLYGRNATAGAVNLITNKPTHEFGGDASVQFGNYDHREIEVALNLPLSDLFAVRFAGQSIAHSGYLSDGYDDQKQSAGRISLLAEPTSTLSFLMTVDYAHFGGRGSGSVLGPFIDPRHPFLGPSSPQAVAVYAAPPVGFLESPPTAAGYLDNAFSGFRGTVNWDTGVGELTVIGSTRKSNFRYSGYTAGFRLDDDETSTSDSIEARFATPERDRLRGVAGVYYFKDEGNFDLSTYITDLIPPGADPTHLHDFKTHARAAFGQATFDLTPTLRLVGGARYSRENKSDSGTINPVNAPFGGSVDYSKVTWKGGLEADVTPTSLAYFTVGTGFKAGGFYTAAPPNTFGPEFLTAWTLGSKNRFLDNRLQINGELFYWDYKDKQVNHLGPINPGGFSLITENAGKATLYGLEMDARMRVTSLDTLSGNLLYENTRYGSYVVNVSPIQPATACGVTQLNPITYRVNCTGNSLALAPKWTDTLDYTHTFPLQSGAKIDASLDNTFKSRYWLGEEHVPGQLQASYGLTDLSAAYVASEERYSIGAYVDNVGNRAVSTFSFVQPLLGRPVEALLPPRTYGVRAHVRF